MEKRTSALARIVAALALVVAVVALVVAISSSTGGDSTRHHQRGTAHAKKHHQQSQQTTAKTYEIQTGDTLTSIAQKTGVPVGEIEALNPGIDPQVLIAGETLKLR
jgi:LysM repeat protein